MRECALVQGVMDPEREFVLDLIRRMQQAAGMNLTGLPRFGGVSASTLTRFVKGSPNLPTTRTLLKLSKKTGVPIGPVAGGVEFSSDRLQLATALGAAAKALGIELSEAAALAGGDDRLQKWIKTILDLPPEADGRALETLRTFARGYLAGQQDSEPLPPKGAGGPRRKAS